MHLHIVAIPVSTLYTSSLRLTTLGRIFDFIDLFFQEMHRECQPCISPVEPGLLGTFSMDTTGAKGKKYPVLNIWGTTPCIKMKVMDEFVNDNDHHKNLAACRSYTRCNHPGRLEAGSEGSPGRRYHLRVMGDEGVFSIFLCLL